MNFRAIGLAAGLWAAAIAAQAQTIETKAPSIIVVGRGEAVAPADWATLSFNVRGEGRSQVDALQAVADGRARVEAGLKALSGTKRMKVETGDLSVREVRGDDCGRSDESDYPGQPKLSTGKCAVAGYVAVLRFTATIAPATRLGDAASLATQLGARDVDLGEAGVDHPEQIEDRAARAALEDAARQARLIAAASGARLGPIVRIQDTRQVAVRLEGTTRVDDLVSLPQAFATPRVRLDLSVPPITRRASYVVVYEIAR